MTRRTRWALVGLIMAAPYGVGTAIAQQSATQASSPFKPIKAPSLDPDIYKAPPKGDGPTLKSGKEQQKPFRPNRIEVGKYQIELNAGHAKDFASGTGPISGGSADPSAPNPTQNNKNSVVPDYFGLKVSTPIH
jgi:hypothetical protein